ncbi:MAG: nitroreductase family protein [Rikenellaceae bacterium]|jgi:nitroreductase|nr:nitroreductase family protein [Rikenellaceae bacterium]
MDNPIFTHRSIRKYKGEAIPSEVLRRVLEAGTRASNTGNMQVYSIIVTTDPALKEELSPAHFNQPMVRQAPALLTFCADIHRFSLWCEQRGARPEYDNFLWYVNAAIDAMLAAQNVMLEAEANGLGICVLGTTTYMADKITETLKLPRGVIPVTSIVMGYPDEAPPLTDRLPLEAVVHADTYHDYTPERIDALWAEREASEETKNLLAINDLTNLARIFTEKRYPGRDNIAFSKAYFETLKRQGFWND